jgi:hypothetical protein
MNLPSVLECSRGSVFAASKVIEKVTEARTAIACKRFMCAI